MATVPTKCEVEVYEVNGQDIDRKLRIRSHWNRENMVVIQAGDDELTVKADDLIKAVNRCSG